MRAHRVYGSAAEANVAVADRCLSAPGWPRPDLAGPYSRAAVLDSVQQAPLRWRIFTVPGRLVHSGRRRHLRLPTTWPWVHVIEQALLRVQAIPMR